MPRTGFLYTLDAFPAAGLADLRPSFARLPPDPYIEGRFRRRRYSHFSGRPNALRRLTHQSFQQSRAVNYLLGGVRREYEELEDGLVALDAFTAMIATYIDHLGIDPTVTDFGVHQIRILCSPGFAGDPAPEGIHQDGFDYVGIFCVDRVNVVGAATHLYKALEGKAVQPPIFNKELSPGEVVFVNDREVFHYTDPLRPRAPGEGHRDVFVITA
jgi:hypothetical protein